MSSYVMVTWSDPINPNDTRLLFSYTYDKGFGWIGTRFNSESEARKAGEEYLKNREEK